MSGQEVPRTCTGGLAGPRFGRSRRDHLGRSRYNVSAASHRGSWMRVWRAYSSPAIEEVAVDGLLGRWC